MKRSVNKRLAAIGLLMSGLCLVAWAMSMYWAALYAAGGVSVATSAGCIGVGWSTGLPTGLTLEDADPRQFTWFIRIADHQWIVVAYWIPLFVFTVLSFILWRAGRRPLPGHCPCGYNLTGNVSGRCPECGREVDYKDIPKQPPGPA
ncbi:MAG: hypothetical protein J5J06_01295 [Phycisphaerae bacterium]|nr:hypothetical protein [Phycisphaerae bacterium]